MKEITNEEIMAAHKGGKLTTESKEKLQDFRQLSIAYTPGVAHVCKEIHKDPSIYQDYTIANNTVAIVTDGTAVLGLGDIGPKAAMPVMEGKAVLFKEFAGVDAFPILVDTTDVEEIIETVKRIAPTFGGINLEDIAAPRCFEIERRLVDELDIPVFHDDQMGTAVVTLAGLINALKVVDKKIEDVKIIINGAGAAGMSILRLLTAYGAKNIIGCDRSGVISSASTDLNDAKKEFLNMSNPNDEQGQLADVMKDADVFIGVSAPGVVSREMVESMNDKSIVFAMANPVPEIMPDLIKDVAAVIATGRSDFPNQINNVLCFPGLFKGLLEARASKITIEMLVKAADAIADIVTEDDRAKGTIIPPVFDKRVVEAVSGAVKSLVS